MTDCSSIHGGSTSSSDITSSRGPNPRIRLVRLCRPHSNTRGLLVGQGSTLFGFAIRGGREFGTGFFISNVEKSSEADIRGLKVGDQIIRVNGYHVDDAVHKELSQFISSQDRLTLKVRGVGMIPIKERSSDPLSWHIVPLKILTTLGEYSVSRDVRINLNVAPRTKLGLGICKGPEWKPGIFVQFTKESGVAQDSGLRPGDQILSCNGIDFTDVLFSDAVSVMKSNHSLELVVRTAAGLDLFPGESSGYNSSASSVTEDQSPCWGDQASKRLSIVTEEAVANERYDHFRAKRLEHEKRREKLHPVNPPRIPNFRQNEMTTQTNSNTNNNNTTVIQLCETGTVINNTLIPGLKNCKENGISTTVHLESNGDNVIIRENSHEKSSTKLADICFVTRQSETKTVTVEVHRNGLDDKIPPPPAPFLQHNRNSSISSSISLESSNYGGSSLCSAISDELKKRAERMQSSSQSTSPDLFKEKPKLKGAASITGQSDDKHNALMDEFKKAHKKMFRNGFTEDGEPIERDGKERQQQQKQQQTNGFSDIKSKDEIDRVVINDCFKKGQAPPPPPLPPSSQKQQQQQNQDSDGPPMTPIPDYDSTPTDSLIRNGQSPNKINSVKGTMGRCAASEMAKANGDMADMESIESFKLNNPSSPKPRPPSVYFNPQSSGPPTMKKSLKPISVTIGEYSGGRKEPTKFDFIKRNGNEIDDEDVSSKLKNELEKTLSRSNLKKRNETDLIDQNRTTTVLLNGTSKPVLQKTQSANIEKLSAMISAHHLNNNNNNSKIDQIHQSTNKVTISIPSHPELRKSESSPPNGILKTSANGRSSLTSTNGQEHKNIKFGNITMVIGER